MTTDVIPAEIEINKTIASLAIKKVCSMSVLGIRKIGEGWDNQVYLAEVKGEKLVFRFPRREIGIRLLKREIALLPKLASLFGLSIPNPKYVCQGTEAYPHVFYGHQLIEGVSGCRVKLTMPQYRTAAEVLGRQLKALHALDPELFKTSEDDLSPVFDRSDVKNCSDMFLARRERVVGKFDLAPYNKLLDEIYHEALAYKPIRDHFSVIHGDLYNRHLIFNGANKLVGMIDWGDSCINDPAIDTSIMYQFFPKKVHADFLNAYGKISEESLKYSKFWAAYYAVTLLWYGMDRDDRPLIESSKATLTMLSE